MGRLQRTHKHHEIEQRELPVIGWSRLRFDLELYLGQQVTPGHGKPASRLRHPGQTKVCLCLPLPQVPTFRAVLCVNEAGRDKVAQRIPRCLVQFTSIDRFQVTYGQVGTNVPVQAVERLIRCGDEILKAES